MAIFGSILSVARTALATQQAAIQNTSHNIANAQTAGYSRQRVEMTSLYPLVMPFGSVGTGVGIADITRARDSFLDVSFRRETANAGGYGMRHDLVSEIEGILNEPSDTALASSLDQFWNSWADLSNNPGSAIAQGVVRQRGAQVANMLNSNTARLNELVGRTNGRLTQTVADVNTLTAQVAALNGEIVASESAGNQAPDLRDARDQVADQLSQLGISRSELQKDGTLSVYVGGVSVVSGNQARQIDIRSAATMSIGIVGDPESLIGVGGALASMLDFINVDSKATQSRLDVLAKGIVNGVNEYHTSGWTAAGDALGGANWNIALPPTGSRINFFDAASLTAGTIKLSAEVQSNAAVIASGDVQNAPGNNTVALAIGALRDDGGMDALGIRLGANFASVIGMAAGTSYSEHYQQTVSDVGIRVSDAANQRSVYETLASQSDLRRMSVSGVSIDEELTKLMQYQQAYSAAAKVVSTVDEMMQTLLNM